MTKYSRKLIFLVFIFLFISCNKRILSPSIGNQMSFPGKMLAIDSTHFLLLNTTANGDYEDGSIHQYSVDANGNYTLNNVVTIPQHASDIAISKDAKLVALSYDGTYKDTQIQLYNYSDTSKPLLLSNITLSGINNTGGKQVVKRLGFFSPSTDLTSYYLYGVIYTYALDDGNYANIPPRVFVAKIAKDFSSSRILFTLSYGVNDSNSLSQQSTALDPLNSNVQYTFGFSSPSYDETHDLLIAFPSGTMGGNNRGINSYPGLPDPLTYFAGKGNVAMCYNGPCSIQTDYRAVSLAVVDFKQIIAGEPLNNSTYYVPLGWNQNGIPFAAKSNSNSIYYPNNPSITDLNSFSFQSNFWSSSWPNTPSLGDSSLTCFPKNVVTTDGSSAGTTINQYSLAGDNGVFVVKAGQNGTLDYSNNGLIGNGNEVFHITGLDLLSNNISSLRNLRGSINTKGESDFSNISNIQIVDSYNKYYTSISTNWLTGSSGYKNAGPLTPYIYSRTSTVKDFDATQSIISNISVLNLGNNVCRPFWIRNTLNSTRALGIDSSWLGTNTASLTPAQNSIFPDASIDPTQPSHLKFSSLTPGVQSCVSLSPKVSTPLIYCVNFLTSSITRYNVSSANPIFNPF